MNKKPLVSIITPVYNGEKHIENTIQSVLGQTYKNIEYIIVDGGSTDNTVGIIKKYESNIAKWISEKDKGISDAFNKGIALATGEIIGIINADDWYEPNAVELVINAINGFDITYGNIQYWNENQKDYLFTANHELLSKEMSVNHPTVFVKREIYEKHGVFDISYKCAMDYDLMLRFYVNGAKFKYINEVIANMRLAGMSDDNWMKGVSETLAIKNKYLGNSFTHKWYYAKHIAAIYIAKNLKSSALEPIMNFYRNNFSKIKKTRD